MPSKPPSALGSRSHQRRAYDHRRNRDQPWRSWYGTARWQAIAKHQLTVEPLCAICLKHGRVRAATVCDHVDRHEGRPEAFWSGPFQSLCAHCHNSLKQRDEIAARRAPEPRPRPGPWGGAKS